MDTETKHSLTLLDVWPEAGLGPVYLTSFTFHGPFFETVLLPHLLDRDANPVTVFVDRGVGYQSAITSLAGLSSAGRDYYLIPVDRKEGVFHPKVHLFCGTGKAVVGSGNLTPSGCGKNLEAFDLLDDATEPTAMNQIREFFLELLNSDETLIDHEDRNLLSGKISPLLSGGGTTRFFHTLSGPLSQQVEDWLLQDESKKTVFAAPFHDGDHYTSRYLKNMLGAEHVELAANPLEAPPKSKEFIQGALIDSKKRPLHAKIIYRMGEETTFTVIGSANLTNAAWDGRNVEGIVVRQELEPNAFSQWRDACPFQKQRWKMSAPKERTITERDPLLSLRNAIIHRGRILVSMDPVESEVNFWLDDGFSRKKLDLEKIDESQWEGPSPFEPARPLIIVAKAPGFSETVLILNQTDELTMPAWERRYHRVFRRKKGQVVDDGLRIDVLKYLGDLFAQMYRISKGRQTGETVPSVPPPAAVTTGIDSNKLNHVAPIAQVDELQIGGIRKTNSIKHQLNSLRDLIKTVTGGDEKDDDDIGGWRPIDTEHLPDIEADKAASARTKTSGTTTEESPEKDPDEKKKPERSDGIAVIEMLIKLAADTKEMLPALLDSNPQEASAITELILQLLTEMSGKYPHLRGALTHSLADCLTATWSVAEWPLNYEGWAINMDPERAPSTTLSELSLFLYINFLEEDGRVSHGQRDQARRILLGINSVAENQKNQPIPSGMLYWKNQEKMEKDKANLLIEPSISEQAKERLLPLWNLQRASENEIRIRQAYKKLESEVSADEKTITRYSKRSSSHKDAAARLEETKPQLEKLSAELLSAEEARDHARNIIESIDVPDKPDGYLFNLWKRSKGLVPPMEKRGCGSCFMELPRELGQKLNDPREIIRCPQCQCLIAAGPPPEWEDE